MSTNYSVLVAIFRHGFRPLVWSPTQFGDSSLAQFVIPSGSAMTNRFSIPSFTLQPRKTFVYPSQKYSASRNTVGLPTVQQLDRIVQKSTRPPTRLAVPIQ